MCVCKTYGKFKKHHICLEYSYDAIKNDGFTCDTTYNLVLRNIFTLMVGS